MRHASPKKRQVSDFERQPSRILRQRSSNRDIGPSTARFLRRLYPGATADMVAADLASWRVPRATIAKMLERESAPSPALLIALTFAYGPEFLSALMASPPAWLEAARRDARQRAFERDYAALRRAYRDCAVAPEPPRTDSE